ncbi:hypothetical protein PFLA_a3274 [Pseudoalteromonas flavipulchra NCIMB 2033 = ATCC BAA-314]|nr:hypothetical protein [Pseudoalteromonas flavipulchra NCIMB 2033 = ATCC BAA-314]
MHSLFFIPFYFSFIELNTNVTRTPHRNPEALQPNFEPTLPKAVS